MTKGILYIVPTPIGNLSDMTLRAVEVLKQVALIGAEDTRQSGVLLRHYEISTPLISYHKFNEKSRLDKFVSLLLSGKDVAIISDAGTPGISDPAAVIIKEAIRQEVDICTLPGATAFLPALVSSGFNTERFLFCGFLPAKESERMKLLKEISPLPFTLIFYEAPHRLYNCLKYLYDHLGNRRIVIARELTKKFETYYRETISYFLENREVIKEKGEFTIVCEGITAREVVSDSEILENLHKYISQGEMKSSAITIVSKKLNVPKNRVYTLAHRQKD